MKSKESLLLSLYQKELEVYPYKDHMLKTQMRTKAQMYIRLKNNAMLRAVALYMLQTGVGYDYVKDDIVKDQDRANHYGVAIGHNLGPKGRRAKNYYERFAQVLKDLRKATRKH